MKEKKLKGLFVILVSFCLVFSTRLVKSNAAAHSNEYGNWSWLYGANALTVQLFSDMYEPYVSNAAFAWNNITSKVYIKSVYYLPPAHGNQDCDIEVYDDALTGTTLAYTQIYSRGLVSLVTQSWDYSGVIVKSRIVLDNSRLIGLGTAQINRTTTHEFGHALALLHPECTEKAVMHQSAVTEYKSDTITNHDRENLKAKWN
ncbi:MAG: hypothetical protein K2N63_11220 [Lachnospiraceae bacterium]|nr:hypothetical protein [Lachnospiraceae bacterium]